MQHSRDYSASASARWLNCPGSVVAVRGYKNRGSSAALQGSCAHQLGDIGLSKNLNEDELKSYLGKSLSDAPDVVIDKEMVNHVQGYIDYCRSFTGDHFVEVKVSYENLVIGGFGTSDFIAIDSINKKIVCVDLKYGMQEVSAINNTQAQLYACGVVNEYEFIYDFDESWLIEMHIYQPRINNFSDWIISFNDLLEFGEFVKDRVALTKLPNAPFNPSEKSCQWCAHKVNCTALFKHTEKIIGAEFDDLDLPSPETVDYQSILSNKILIESWLKAVQELAFEKLNNGEKVKGYKLVAGRSSRKWSNTDKAFNILSEHYNADQLETRKFITVPQAEKLTGKAKFSDFDDLVVKSEGKPTIAPESDKRKPFNDVSCDFEKIN